MPNIKCPNTHTMEAVSDGECQAKIVKIHLEARLKANFVSQRLELGIRK